MFDDQMYFSYANLLFHVMRRFVAILIILQAAIRAFSVGWNTSYVPLNAIHMGDICRMKRDQLGGLGFITSSAWYAPSKVQYTYFDGLTWTSSIILGNYYGTFPELAYDSNNVPITLFNYGWGESHSTWLRQRNGSGWVGETIGDVREAAFPCRFAVGPDGTWHVAYKDGLTGNLIYSHKVASIWNPEQLDTLGDVQMIYNVFCSPTGVVSVVYRDAFGLKVASNDGGTWHDILSLPTNIYFDAAANEKGEIALIYWLNGTLICRLGTGPEAQSSTLSSEASFGAKILWGQKNRLGIAFVHGTLANRSISYFERTGLKWTKELVVKSDVAQINDAAFLQSGRPAICFTEDYYFSAKISVKRSR
jgi:hypothetical protein